jgi:hypothetical protein
MSLQCKLPFLPSRHIGLVKSVEEKLHKCIWMNDVFFKIWRIEERLANLVTVHPLSLKLSEKQILPHTLLHQPPSSLQAIQVLWNPRTQHNQLPGICRSMQCYFWLPIGRFPWIRWSLCDRVQCPILYIGFWVGFSSLTWNDCLAFQGVLLRSNILGFVVFVGV